MTDHAILGRVLRSAVSVPSCCVAARNSINASDGASWWRHEFRESWSECSDWLRDEGQVFGSVAELAYCCKKPLIFPPVMKLLAAEVENTGGQVLAHYHPRCTRTPLLDD